jgi:hypothetical protein
MRLSELPSKGTHTKLATSLALSFDDVLLASASWNDTINLWAFESHQLLASFDVQDFLDLSSHPTHTNY